MLCRGSLDKPHDMPKDLQGKARVGNHVHKKANINNLIEPFLGAWVHCPICLLIVRSKQALTQHMQAWHMLTSRNRREDWRKSPGNYSINRDGVRWCPLCDFHHSEALEVYNHLKTFHDERQLLLIGFYFFMAESPLDFDKAALKFYCLSLPPDTIVARNPNQLLVARARDLMSLCQSNRLSDYATDDEV